MGKADVESGRAELRGVMRESRGLFWCVGLFSIFCNLLLLTGPIYMLQVYDRVLVSQSLSTLLALTILAAFLYAVMGVLDHARAQVMARIGSRFQQRLERRVFDAMLQTAANGRAGPQNDRLTGGHCLETVQRLMASQSVLALFDLPWVPLLLIGIALFHPWLGALGLGGAALLVILAMLNQIMVRRSLAGARQASAAADAFGAQIGARAETVQGVGLAEGAFARWHGARLAALAMQMQATDIGGSLTAAIRTLRLFLQTGMLGLGAWLVIRDEVSAGTMIAASILLARGLAPLEQLIGGWPLFADGQRAWNGLATLLGSAPIAPSARTMPAPTATLEVQGLTVVAPGTMRPALRNLSFHMTPGQAIGVIGPSGAGKSALARCLTGTWRPQSGTIRLDGTDLAHRDGATMRRSIGYLPQKVQLFDGTIAENIARLSPEFTPDSVVAAARRAGVHDMILGLPDGYDTRIAHGAAALSGGQVQRIGLARAMFGDPVILVLDEPGAHLESTGLAALNKAVRDMKSEGRAVLIMTHQPMLISDCDTILVLDAGQRMAFGARDEVLNQVLEEPGRQRPGFGQDVEVRAS